MSLVTSAPTKSAVFQRAAKRAPGNRRSASPLGACLQFARALHAQPCSPVAVTARSAVSDAGRIEPEATEGTEPDSTLCFLCYLLLNSETGS